MSGVVRDRAVPFGWDLCRAAAIRIDDGLLTDNDVPDLGIAIPESLARSVPKRRREFVLGRYCAKIALADLGLAEASREVAIGADRGPRWPKGVVGSITHDDSLVMAVVARRMDLMGVGIDCEPLLTRERGGQVAALVASARERSCATAVGLGPEAAVTLIFSAKESLFKCLFPLCGTFFDFQDATLVAIDSAASRCTLKLERQLSTAFSPGDSFVVDYRLGDARVLTGTRLLETQTIIDYPAAVSHGSHRCQPLL